MRVVTLPCKYPNTEPHTFEHEARPGGRPKFCPDHAGAAYRDGARRRMAATRERRHAEDAERRAALLAIVARGGAPAKAAS